MTEEFIYFFFGFIVCGQTSEDCLARINELEDQIFLNLKKLSDDDDDDDDEKKKKIY